MINREKTLIMLQAEKNKVMSESELYDSDGDIYDEGAVEYLGQIEEVMATLRNPLKTEWDIRAIAECVGLESFLKEQ